MKSRRAPAACASVIGRWAPRIPGNAPPAIGVADHAEGPADRGPHPRDPLHHAVLRGFLRAGVRVRLRGRGAGVGRRGAGILWIAIAFSGTLALGRTFERE